MRDRRMKVVALAGGVGGAKLVDGLAALLPPEDLTVVVNTGDDFQHLGLSICPDLDTITYTLAGLANPRTGWGRRDESWSFLEALGQLGGPTWFRLGDRDLALHVQRTRRLAEGRTLSQVTAEVCAALDVKVRILPMSDQPVSTRVLTEEGELTFQEYFVARACEPRVNGFRLEGLETAQAAPGVLQALREAEAVILCPSNPWVSLDPILALPGVRPSLALKVALGVSPIVGGQAVKGPAAKMFRELGIEPSALAVAQHYRGLLAGLVIDRQDHQHIQAIRELGLQVWEEQTIMRNPRDRRRLARFVLECAAVGLPA
ncbi:MAG TPA: 2-phospho-L-lactate transferase [Anaerolineales bacterium]|nr:2-phospho-L-lactate transferase [Anaerolineales bacterium]